MTNREVTNVIKIMNKIHIVLYEEDTCSNDRRVYNVNLTFMRKKARASIIETHTYLILRDDNVKYISVS